MGQAKCVHWWHIFLCIFPNFLCICKKWRPLLKNALKLMKFCLVAAMCTLIEAKKPFGAFWDTLVYILIHKHLCGCCGNLGQYWAVWGRTVRGYSMLYGAIRDCSGLSGTLQGCLWLSKAVFGCLGYTALRSRSASKLIRHKGEARISDCHYESFAEVSKV